MPAGLDAKCVAYEAPDAELARLFEGEDGAPECWAHDRTHERLKIPPTTVFGEETAQLAGRRRILEKPEGLEAGGAMPTVPQREMALAIRPGGPEDRLGPKRDRVAQSGIERGSNGSHEPKFTRAGIRRPWTKAGPPSSGGPCR